MPRQRLLPFGFCLLLFAYCLLPSVLAQGTSATLSGTVIDQNGAIVPGVAISVTNPATALERTATTTDGGYFTIPLLPPGNYTITARRDGFAAVKIPVVLNVGDQKALQIQLRAGDVNAQVTIDSSAETVRTDGGVGTVVNRQFVENIPLNGRSFQSLIQLTPGVVLTPAGAGREGQFSVNGQRSNSNYVTVDGVSANFGSTRASGFSEAGGGTLPAFNVDGTTSGLVSTDALQEFRIQTSTYAPEFGRQPGGQVSIVTRSGDNGIRGTAFEYFRNDVLDANDWFGNRSGLARPKERQNDFGGVLGGPIIKNRTFFFFSFEGSRLLLPTTQIRSVPSVASRQDPSASAAARALMNAYPIPNGGSLPDGFATAVTSVSDPTNLNATAGRIDQSFGKSTTLFVRYNYAPSSSSVHGVFGKPVNNVGTTNFKNQTFTVGVTQAITSALINEIRVNYSESRASSFVKLDNTGGAVPLSDSQVFPSFASSRDSSFNVTLIGGAGLQFGKNAINTQRQLNLVDNLSNTKGTHSLKAGVDYRRMFPIANPLNYQQLLIFDGLTGPSGLIGSKPEFALVFASTTSNGILLRNKLLINNLSAYVQDTWRITRNLNLTYGLRWDVDTPIRSTNGLDLYTVRGLDNPSTMSLAPKGTPMFKTNYGNFAPRIGVAYAFGRNPARQTVLRGGFGIFYDLIAGMVANDVFDYPYGAIKFLTDVTYPLTADQASPPPFSSTPTPDSPVSSLDIADPNLKSPKTYQWNAAIEHSFGRNDSASLSYVGAAGHRLLRTESLINPNPLFGTVNVARGNGISHYRSLQFQFQHRLSRLLQALVSYSWQRSTDTASTDVTTLIPSQKIDPNTDLGPSDFDVRHVFGAALTYALPASNTGFGAIFFRNWSLSGIVRAQSAAPVDITYSRNIGFGNYSFRPDIVPGVPRYINDATAPGGRRINKAAFVIPIDARQGTLGRNALRAFSLAQIDVGIHRQFELTEKTTFQIRAEFFNVLNHPNFGPPVNNFRSGLFGQSTQMFGRSLTTGGVGGGYSPLYQIGGPRSIQLALRISF
jgi:hypothetical protein